MSNTLPNLVYGFNNALSNVPRPPIVLNVSPTIGDKAAFGQIWINKSINTAYILTSIVNNQANWEAFSGAVTFSSLTVNPGPISLTGTTTINTTGAQSTTIGTGGTGVVTIGNGTGNTNIQGNLGVNGFVNILAGAQILAAGLSVEGPTDLNVGGTGITQINVGGTGAVNIGNSSAPITITGTTEINTTGTSQTIIGGATSNILLDGLIAGGINVAGTTMINTTGSDDTEIGVGGTGLVSIGNTTSGTEIIGNVEIEFGSVALDTAGSSFTLPGPVNIISGAGVPSGALATNVGNLYINTTATTATTRLYIANTVGTWTSFTALA